MFVFLFVCLSICLFKWTSEVVRLNFTITSYCYSDFTNNILQCQIKRDPFLSYFSANFRRTRSKSGSPPSRVSSSMGFRPGIQAGQPVSLPPIFNSSDGLPTSGPTSLTSGYSSMSSRLGTASSSSSVLTPRSSSNLKIDGKVRSRLFWLS